MFAVLMTLVSTIGVMAAGIGLAVAVREYSRRHPDPAWKPTGYRVRC